MARKTKFQQEASLHLEILTIKMRNVLGDNWRNLQKRQEIQSLISDIENIHALLNGKVPQKEPISSEKLPDNVISLRHFLLEEGKVA